MVQVLRIEREAEEITVFYRPNSLGVEELSRNPVENALAVTFLISSEEVQSCPISLKLSPSFFCHACHLCLLFRCPACICEMKSEATIILCSLSVLASPRCP